MQVTDTWAAPDDTRGISHNIHSCVSFSATVERSSKRGPSAGTRPGWKNPRKKTISHRTFGDGFRSARHATLLHHSQCEDSQRTAGFTALIIIACIDKQCSRLAKVIVRSPCQHQNLVLSYCHRLPKSIGKATYCLLMSWKHSAG